MSQYILDHAKRNPNRMTCSCGRKPFAFTAEPKMAWLRSAKAGSRNSVWHRCAGDVRQGPVGKACTGWNWLVLELEQQIQNIAANSNSILSSIVLAQQFTTCWLCVPNEVKYSQPVRLHRSLYLVWQIAEYTKWQCYCGCCHLRKTDRKSVV